MEHRQVSLFIGISGERMWKLDAYKTMESKLKILTTSVGKSKYLLTYEDLSLYVNWCIGNDS